MKIWSIGNKATQPGTVQKTNYWVITRNSQCPECSHQKVKAVAERKWKNALVQFKWLLSWSSWTNVHMPVRPLALIPSFRLQPAKYPIISNYKLLTPRFHECINLPLPQWQWNQRHVTWGLPFLFFTASFSIKGVQKLFSFYEFYDFHKNNDHCWVSVPCNENLPKQEKNDLGVKP